MVHARQIILGIVGLIGRYRLVVGPGRSVQKIPLEHPWPKSRLKDT